MEQTFKATEINIGFHPAGYRIDKTALPMNLYTKWEISEDGNWLNPKPVDFDAMPIDGWFKEKGFNWNQEV